MGRNAGVSLTPTREVTRQTIGLIEAGRYNPSIKLCLALARATGQGLDELFWIQGER